MVQKTNRIALFSLVLGLIIILGLGFASWTAPHILQPAALTAWLFIRIFILSVDQEYFWWLLILLGLMWAFFRLLRRKETASPGENPAPNEALADLQYWQEMLSYANGDGRQRALFKQELILLLSSHFASQRPRSSEVEIRQALESGQLPLPETLYDFLFLAEQPGSRPVSGRGSLPVSGRGSRLLSKQALARAGRRWVRRVTGRETADFQRLLTELMRFIEKPPEIENERTIH